MEIGCPWLGPSSLAHTLTQHHPASVQPRSQPRPASSSLGHKPELFWLVKPARPTDFIKPHIVSSAQASAPSGFTEAGAVRVWGGPAAYSGLTTRGDFVIFEGGPAYRYQSVMVARVPVF